MLALEPVGRSITEMPSRVVVGIIDQQNNATCVHSVNNLLIRFVGGLIRARDRDNHRRFVLATAVINRYISIWTNFNFHVVPPLNRKSSRDRQGSVRTCGVIRTLADLNHILKSTFDLT